jgi:hypothetical protein
MLISRQQELHKLEEQRISGVETQATAILTLVVAISAFGASALNSGVLAKNTLEIGAVALLLLISAGFAVAARGPRSLKAGFWRQLDPQYDKRERDLETRERELEEAATQQLAAAPIAKAILATWQARTAVSSWLADRKALWLTCALIFLLLAFIAAGVAALLVVE